MKRRLWGHDAVTITVPYAVARILADTNHPHRAEVLDAVSEKLTNMLASDDPFHPGPIASIIDGVLLDGADMSMGPVAYVHKAFLEDTEHVMEMLREVSE
jgi:hypothetical protein